MKLDKPYSDKQYASLAIYCNDNNCHPEDKGDYLEAVPNEEPIPTPEQRIGALKAILEKDYDYKHNKYLRGEYTEKEWAVIKSEIQTIVSQIRELENGM